LAELSRYADPAKWQQIKQEKDKGEFEKLTDDKVDTIEKIFAEAYEWFNSNYETSA
jgi:hypothetical protein